MALYLVHGCEAKHVTRSWVSLLRLKKQRHPFRVAGVPTSSAALHAPLSIINRPVLIWETGVMNINGGEG